MVERIGDYAKNIAKRAVTPDLASTYAERSHAILDPAQPRAGAGRRAAAAVVADGHHEALARPPRLPRGTPRDRGAARLGACHGG